MTYFHTVVYQEQGESLDHLVQRLAGYADWDGVGVYVRDELGVASPHPVRATAFYETLAMQKAGFLPAPISSLV